jgi:rare lipoprotein A
MTPKKGLSCLLFLLLVTAVSCAPRAYRPPSKEVVYREKGVASWYGPKFHGRKTSSGERFNMYAMTAAHRTLPLGSIVRVTHIGNGKKVVLKINDRGPFVEGRIIDLSYGAARTLGMVKEGVARVTVEAFAGQSGIPSIGSSSSFFLQVGSFGVRENAEKLEADLRSGLSGVPVSSSRDKRGSYFRVRVGPFDSEEDAMRTGKELEKKGLRYLLIQEY